VTGRPSDAELARLAATAETAADHRALQNYFTSVATRDEREAADHAAYAKTWRGLTKVAAYQTQAAAHDRAAEQLRAAAKEARAAAAMHGSDAAKAK
jgi:ABC-type branched-subunit amino acid transport system substrate-binding protein